jgi:rhodanese-related sulfurtransferase
MNAPTPTRTPPSVADLVAAAKATIDCVDPERLAREAAKVDTLVVDLRESEELDRRGRIAGALHAPRGMLEFYADASSPHHLPAFRQDGRIILYCASGGRSALAVKALQGLGYSNVAHLDGGFSAWRAAGFPIANGR